MKSIIDELYHLAVLASKVALLTYSIILIPLSILDILIEPDMVGFLFIFLSFLIFFVHAKYTHRYTSINWHNFWNDKNTANKIYSFGFNFLLSMSLAVFVLSFISPTLSRALIETSADLDKIGGIAFGFMYLFLYMLVLSLASSLLQKIKNIFVSLFLIVGIFLIYLLSKNYLEASQLSERIGLFILGPIHLLILKFLFTKEVQPKKKYLISF